MKRAYRSETTVLEAARVGEELRDARVALGVSLEEAATQLRINKRYLQALEEGRVRDLPGAAYAVGFVRSYASALGLDADEAVRRFRDVSGPSVTKSGELVFPEPVPNRGIPTGILAAIGAAIAIGGYVAWWHWSGADDRVVDAVPPLPPRLERAANEGQALRPEREAATASETSAAAAPTPSAPPPVLTAPAAPPAPPAPVIDPDKPRIILRALGESWVQIRDNPANRTLVDRVLREGESIEIPPRPGLVLTTGKAENLDLVLDGQSVDAFGGPGVRRNIPLEPEKLRPAGTATPRPAQPAPAAQQAAPMPPTPPLPRPPQRP